MIGTEDQDKFVSESRWAVVTTMRRNGTPSSSVVFYYRDGDTVVFSTTDDRLKTRSVEHNPQVAVCVIDEGPPHRYVTIEGPATVQREDVAGGHVRLNRAMRRDPDWQPPENFAEVLAGQKRVLIHVAAERVHGVVNRG